MAMIPDAIDPDTSLPRPMRVLMVAAELAPFARAGGLGDMMQGLSSAMGAMGIEIVVVTPYYGEASDLRAVSGLRQWPRPLWVSIGRDVRQVHVIEATLRGPARVLLLEHAPLFDRPYIYGPPEEDYPDNDLRFALLGAAALEAAEALWDGPPDVLHAQDWPAALALAYARLSGSESWKRVPSVFTFHNLAFQGAFPIQRAERLGLPQEALHEGGLVKDGQLNFLAAGISYADRVTTVSPSYAREVLTPEFSWGFASLLSRQASHLVGITNGIDLDTWNPSTDRHIAARYDTHDTMGKLACRDALASELGLEVDDDRPLVGMVTRLTPQKGMQVVLERLEELLSRGWRFAIVAVGEGPMRDRLEHIQKRFRGKLAFVPAFGDPLARRVYAGADVFLMPSLFEPCGLGQQYAMRYGTVPVASAVGGLIDTIEPIDPERATGTGILFPRGDSDAMVEALERTARWFRDRPLWQRIVHNCMVRDASWDTSAKQLFALYRDIAGAPPRPSLPPPVPVAPASQPSPPPSERT